MKIIKLKPSFSERIWGGTKLKEMGFDAPTDKKIGEAWVLSAHENGMGYVAEGEFEGMSLLDLFNKHRELFGDFEGEFPLLVKIIAADDYLSVQVHPNDEYALKKHNALGKPECWYIVDCPDNANIIYGHNAQTKEEFRALIENGEWDKLLGKKPIKKGDFMYVAPGKVHAITPGVTVYELQRSSDITYRLYDYDRVDDKGNARELHIEDSIENTKIPDDAGFFVENAQGFIFDSEFFSLYKLDSKHLKKWNCPEETKWLQFTVLSGSGTINGKDFKAGDCAISIDGVEEVEVEGEDLVVLISWIRN